MRVIAHNSAATLWLLAVLFLGIEGPLHAQGVPKSTSSALSVIAGLASALSQGDQTGALEVFDSGQASYGAVEAAVGALVAQADILCAIDIVEEKEANGGTTLDVDWFMQLKSRADAGPTERRRERVRLQLRKFQEKWKIVSINPIKILDPIRIDSR